MNPMRPAIPARPLSAPPDTRSPADAPGIPAAYLPTTIGRSLKITGDLYAQQDLVLHGQVAGSIDVPDHALTVQQTGRLDGNAFARIVTLAGAMVGDVTASELVEVLPGASLEGNVAAPRVYLDEAATFRGRIDMRRTDAAVRVARYRLQRKVGGEAR
jgi:cytoskeletal protein CcmA (bactofilin family)